MPRSALRRPGQDVRNSDFPGFDDLFLDAHSNLPPSELFDRARAWLTETFATPLRGSKFKAAADTGAVMLNPPGLTERAVTFGAGLQGVISEPADGPRGSRCVVFCNTGGDPRSGIGGFATQTARGLARRGVASLRFDFAGLGDSPSEGEDRGHVYETPRGADFDAAFDLLAGQGYSEMIVVGLCAGAYHALAAAHRAERVTGAFAISPVKLVWRSGDSLVFGRKDEGKAMRTYSRALRDLETWKRLIRGGVDVGAVVRTVLLRLQGRARGWMAARGASSPLARLQAFAKRGGRACLVMGLR